MLFIITQPTSGSVTHWQRRAKGADGDDLGVALTEQGDEPVREYKAHDCCHQQDGRRDLDAEPERLFDALTLASAIVEAADRLEALAEAYHR